MTLYATFLLLMVAVVRQMIGTSVALEIFPPFATDMLCLEATCQLPVNCVCFAIWCVAPVSAVTVWHGWQVATDAEGETQEK